MEERARGVEIREQTMAEVKEALAVELTVKFTMRGSA